MSDPSTTRERILEISRLHFNERGYAATSLAEIASGVGIAKGNLTYHFPAKYDLVVEIASRARAERRDNLSLPRPGSLADEYVEIVHTAMEQARKFRFLLRDQVQFKKGSKPRGPDPQAAAEIERLHELLKRMQKEGMIRQNLALDLPALARSVWMVSRFWIDHLDQDEGIDEVTWADQERGIRHHFAVLLPCLTASARRQFESALVRLAAHQATLEEERGEGRS
jgi:AcrR family transcriptional regulator